MKVLYRLSIVSAILLIACVFVPASNAVAQNKVSGTIDCDKGDPMHAIPIPDRQGYSFVISQHKCTYTKPIAIEGLEAKEFVNTVFNEVMGASIRTTASGITTYSNGDKGYTRSAGTGDAKAMTRSGKWTFSGGTGKLSGMKGGGTYTCKMKSSEPGVGYTCNIEGEATPLPPKK